MYRVGGIKYVVEPALRLCEALRLGQVHGNGQWNVEEQLPVVRGIRPVFRNINLFGREVDLDEIVIVWIRRIETLEEILAQRGVQLSFQQVLQSAFIQLRDQLPDKGMKEILEGIGELGSQFICHSHIDHGERVVVLMVSGLLQDSVGHVPSPLSSSHGLDLTTTRTNLGIAITHSPQSA